MDVTIGSLTCLPTGYSACVYARSLPAVLAIPTYRDAVFQCSNVVSVRQFNDGQFAFFLHVLDPFVCLTY